MNTAEFIIRTPIWKDRSVGLDSTKIKEHNLVQILVTDKTGKKLYPHTYYVDKDTLDKCPTQKLPHGVTLKLIKIAEMKIK